MIDNKIKNRIHKLREEISKFQKEYHELDSPSVSDEIYDSLVRELRELEEKYQDYSDPNSPIHRVGGKPLESFKKVTHEIRMTSMNDVFSKEEVLEWEKRISKLLDRKHSYFCELKLDGLAVSLIYKDGLFVQGSTRGDGLIGEDITENLKTINTIPLKLTAPYPEYIEVRGEAVMSKKVLDELNKKNEKEGKPILANTRNAAAGSLRQLDSSITRSRKLDFLAYDIAKIEDKANNFNKPKTHSDKHKLLRGFGFILDNHEKEVKNVEEIFNFFSEIEKIRPKLQYGIDGLVVSVNDLDLQQELGIVGKAPRYMIAYKYQAEKATTMVLDISVNVGRTGAITPLAHFKPTLVAGSVVSKATLHNIDQIERLDIRIGDTVVIQKAGDVIPEVVEVISKMRTGKEKKFKMPNKCPVCGSVLEQRNIGEKSTRNLSVAYYCSNTNCPARNRRGMQHFVNVFEIYTVGPRIIDRLKDEGLITDTADLFTLTVSDLSGLERFGAKSAQNIINSIETHKKISLSRFIYALGIINVGEQTALDVAEHFGSLDKIMKADINEINKIENIGPVVSKSIFDYFRQKENIQYIEKLFKNGVIIEKNLNKKGTKFLGKTFVLTGTLPTLSRDDAKKMIINEGGKVSSSVSKKTDYVIVGDEPGSKYNDAITLGISVLDEKAFLKLLS